MSLSIDLRHTLGDFRLEVQAELGPGLTALVGASGAGKTTVLNIIAGILRPALGVVRLDEHVLADSRTGVWEPAHRRRIGYVFQEPRLFPHLTVRQNLLYGRWFVKKTSGVVFGEPAGKRRPTSFDDVIGLLNLSSLLSRSVERLSGGEKQRVALGRALLSGPRLLLLDEPLASVDQEHRREILPYLDRVRAEHAIPTIYVTHTWAEVADRASHVLELDAGRVAKVLVSG
jgi:molybdate transport system ATP-binding protein